MVTTTRTPIELLKGGIGFEPVKQSPHRLDAYATLKTTLNPLPDVIV